MSTQLPVEYTLGQTVPAEIEALAFERGISFLFIAEDLYLVHRFQGYGFFMSEAELLDAIYARTTLESIQVQVANDRAQRRGLLGNLTVSEWSATLVHFNYRCVYCGDTENLTLDHFIPLALGGVSSIWNCLPCCSACNSNKNARHPDEYPIDESARAAIHAYIDPLLAVTLEHVVEVGQ